MKRRDENRIGETVTELFGDEALDAQTALKLEALAALHERKVGALMKSTSAEENWRSSARPRAPPVPTHPGFEESSAGAGAVDVLKEALVGAARPTDPGGGQRIG